MGHLIQFTDIYHISAVFYYSLTQKCGIYGLQNVPQNGAQTNYVPQAPQMGHSWGTEYSPPRDGKYLIFLKNLSILLFYLGLIYRWGKGLKPKMIKTVCFLPNM